MFDFVKNIFGDKDKEEDEITKAINATKKRPNSKFDSGFGLTTNG
jgi:hypothetical protein